MENSDPLKKLSFDIVVVLFVYVLCASPSFAASTEDSFVYAPVYFVTDRIPVKKDGTVNFMDTGQALSKYSSGVKYVPLAFRSDLQATWEHLSSIGWKKQEDLDTDSANSKPTKIADAQKIADSFSKYWLKEDSDSDLTKEIKQLPAFSGGASSSSGELIVYVHGFYNSFDDSIAGAADLSSWFKRPVLVYCWTTPKERIKSNSLKIPFSPIKVKNLTPKIWQSYRESEVTHQHGQQKFNHLIEALSISFKPSNMILIAHSMGSRLLDQALLYRHSFYSQPEEEVKFKSIIFSNPDIDGKYFASHVDDLSDQTKSLKVFFVKHDGAMEVSTFLHGAHNRLGAPDKSIFAELRKGKVSMIDMSNLGKGELGTIGHTMPSWLIANMHKYNTADGTRTKYLEEKPNGDDSMIVIKTIQASKR